MVKRSSWTTSFFSPAKVVFELVLNFLFPRQNDASKPYEMDCKDGAGAVVTSLTVWPTFVRILVNQGLYWSRCLNITL